MTIRVTITKPGVTDAYGIAMAVGTTYTVEENFGLSLIQQGRASDTDEFLDERINAPFDEVVYPIFPDDFSPVGLSVDGTSLVSGDGQTWALTQTYTWATLPAAAAYIGTAHITDVGEHGSLWRSDGATWGIVGGSVVLGAYGADLTVTAASTAEVDLVTLNIPAGLIGINGQLVVTHFWEVTNNANTKTARVKLGGTAFFANATSLASVAIFLPPPTVIWNRNSQSSQMAFAAANGNTSSGTGTAKTTGTVDTSAATTLVISGQKATGSDTMTLLGYRVELVRP